MNKNWRRTFAVIYAGQPFSLLGSSAVQFAVIWWLTARTESALTLTAAAVVSILPNMLLGPFAGVWIDRHNRRTVMMAAGGLVAASSAALGLLFLLLGEPPVGVIYGALFLRGVGGAFHTPAMQAAMLAVWPIAPLMLVDVAGAVFAILCLLGVALPGAPPPGMRQGLRAMRENRPLMVVFPPVMFASVLYMPLGPCFRCWCGSTTGGRRGITPLLNAFSPRGSSRRPARWGSGADGGGGF